VRGWLSPTRAIAIGVSDANWAGTATGAIAVGAVVAGRFTVGKIAADSIAIGTIAVGAADPIGVAATSGLATDDFFDLRACGDSLGLRFR
jgi:hypothetical protein